jgi:hypothetical protein
MRAGACSAFTAPWITQAPVTGPLLATAFLYFYSG